MDCERVRLEDLLLFDMSSRNLPVSSREKPNVVCVRSLVPKVKNSASSAISSAVSAPRGTLDHGADQVLELHAVLASNFLGDAITIAFCGPAPPRSRPAGS